jgi:hypothetical protein
LIRAAHDGRSLLFDNHVSSDDQGLAAAKTNNFVTVSTDVLDRDSGDARLQLHAYTFLSARLLVMPHGSKVSRYDSHKKAELKDRLLLTGDSAHRECS